MGDPPDDRRIPGPLNGRSSGEWRIVRLFDQSGRTGLGLRHSTARLAVVPAAALSARARKQIPSDLLDALQQVVVA
jgi:hypothetical protein